MIWEEWSLTAKLLTIMMALMLLVLTGTSAWVLENLRGSLINRTDDRLTSAAQALAQQAASEVIASPPLSAAGGGNAITQDSIRKLLPANYYVQFYDSDGSKRYQPVGGDEDNVPTLPAVNDSTVKSLAGHPYTVNGTGSQWRVVALGVKNTSLNVAVAIPFDHDVDEVTNYARNSSVGIGLLALAIVAGVGYFAITNTFRPLKDIENTASRIAAGDLTQRVTDYPVGTELGRLSSALNTMLGQIESSFDGRTRSEKRMRQFVSDASHELRTPLVTIRGYAELYRQGAITNPDQIGLAMERIEAEAKRMGVLVEDLVQLARLDEKRRAETGPVDVGRIMRDAAADAVAQAPDREISLIGLDGGDAGPVPPVIGEEPKIRQVIVNLAANAVRHTEPGTAIEFAVGAVDARGEVLTRPAPGARGANQPATALPFGGRPRSDGTSESQGPAPQTGGLGGVLSGVLGSATSMLSQRGGAAKSARDGAAKDRAGKDKAGKDRAGKDRAARDRPARDKKRRTAEKKHAKEPATLAAAPPAAQQPEPDTQAPGVRVRFEIRDHGDGISREDAARIFERFYRVDTSRTRDTGGSGLGLSIVKAIVEGHGGEISVVDTPGGGATFRVDLPAAVRGAAAASTQNSASAQEPASRKDQP